MPKLIFDRVLTDDKLVIEDVTDETESPDRALHTGLEARIAEIITPPMEAQGYELVRVSVIGKETPTVQIMADRADQTSFRLEDCESLSHLLSAVLDVEDPIESAWTLEVSSAGIDRPLTRTKDFIRYAGHEAKVELNFPGPDGRKRYTGVVMGATADEAQLKLPGGEIVALRRADMRRAKLVLTDALIKAFEQPDVTN